MRKWIRLLSVGLLTLLLSGCMGAVPIDRRMLVQAVAIDWQDEQYQVTLQIFSPESREGETGSTELCSVSGPDLEEVLRELPAGNRAGTLSGQLPAGDPGGGRRPAADR